MHATLQDRVKLRQQAVKERKELRERAIKDLEEEEAERLKKPESSGSAALEPSTVSPPLLCTFLAPSPKRINPRSDVSLS